MLCILNRVIVVVIIAIHPMTIFAQEIENGYIGVNTEIVVGNKNDWVTYKQDHSVANFKEMIKRSEFNHPEFDSQSESLNPRPTLQIFVSSSIPKTLLRQYAQEAKRYGGVLILRGLPNGSIHKLTDLVMEISTDNSAPMQIDDQSFKAFGVNVVPTIVLSQSKSIFAEPNKYDKVTGSITIQAALRIFSKSGDLANEARRLLR